jgi:hypothetical protein
MAWINYDGQKYTLEKWRLQCLNCHDVVQTWSGNCDCRLIVIQNGRRTYPYFPVHDVSIWLSKSGSVLPQSIVNKYFNLREPNKTSANTKPSTSTS